MKKITNSIFIFGLLIGSHLAMGSQHARALKKWWKEGSSQQGIQIPQAKVTHEPIDREFPLKGDNYQYAYSRRKSFINDFFVKNDAEGLRLFLKKMEFINQSKNLDYQLLYYSIDKALKEGHENISWMLQDNFTEQIDQLSSKLKPDRPYISLLQIVSKPIINIVNANKRSLIILIEDVIDGKSNGKEIIDFIESQKDLYRYTFIMFIVRQAYAKNNLNLYDFILKNYTDNIDNNHLQMLQAQKKQLEEAAEKLRKAHLEAERLRKEREEAAEVERQDQTKANDAALKIQSAQRQKVARAELDRLRKEKKEADEAENQAKLKEQQESKQLQQAEERYKKIEAARKAKDAQRARKAKERKAAGSRATGHSDTEIQSKEEQKRLSQQRAHQRQQQIDAKRQQRNDYKNKQRDDAKKILIKLQENKRVRQQQQESFKLAQQKLQDQIDRLPVDHRQQAQQIAQKQEDLFNQLIEESEQELERLKGIEKLRKEQEEDYTLEAQHKMFQDAEQQYKQAEDQRAIDVQQKKAAIAIQKAERKRVARNKLKILQEGQEKANAEVRRLQQQSELLQQQLQQELNALPAQYQKITDQIVKEQSQAVGRIAFQLQSEQDMINNDQEFNKVFEKYKKHYFDQKKKKEVNAANSSAIVSPTTLHVPIDTGTSIVHADEVMKALQLASLLPQNKVDNSQLSSAVRSDKAVFVDNQGGVLPVQKSKSRESRRDFYKRKGIK